MFWKLSSVKGGNISFIIQELGGQILIHYQFNFSIFFSPSSHLCPLVPAHLNWIRHYIIWTECTAGTVFVELVSLQCSMLPKNNGNWSGQVVDCIFVQNYASDGLYHFTTLHQYHTYSICNEEHAIGLSKLTILVCRESFNFLWQSTVHLKYLHRSPVCLSLFFHNGSVLL